jgi:transposase
VVNPRRVRDFTRALGTLAKTDVPDTKGLARFGQAMCRRSARLEYPLFSFGHQWTNLIVKI